MKTLNGTTLKAMLESGYANLSNHQKQIDALNVFPVPDGDTGTNMTMTFASGVKDADKINSPRICDVAKALSKGLLMGARGNSGVITSQIFRGFYQYVDGKEEIDVSELAKAMENGAKVAYKAIMKPVEGTILTVIRESSWYAGRYIEEHADIDIEEYFAKLIEYANESLANTPELLPVLKEVGVVDSGGTGLVKILEGFKACLDGKPITISELSEVSESAGKEMANEEFGYCTEFILRLNDKKHFAEDRLRNKLAAIGESLVLVKDEDIVKVHVHTLHPGEALNIGQRYGEFIKLKIENMQEQHSHLQEETMAMPHKKYGIIAVAAGEGLTKLFKDCRADIVISGGQTMNPSTESFVAEIKKLNADHIIILPNNSNIILAAEQAKGMMENLDIHVLPTKSIQEGISALSMFSPEADIADNLSEMEAAVANVQSGSITYAIKDTSFSGINVKEGDFIGMTNKTIVASDKDKMKVIKALLDVMMKKENAELLSLIAGEGSTAEEIAEINQYIADNSELEVEIIEGNQPVYSYLFGVE